MLERGSCFSYTMRPSNMIRKFRPTIADETLPDWLFELSVVRPQEYSRILQADRCRLAEHACSKSRPQGSVDFYIDGEMCLSEPLLRSWDEDGVPTKAECAKTQANVQTQASENSKKRPVSPQVGTLDWAMAQDRKRFGCARDILGADSDVDSEVCAEIASMI